MADATRVPTCPVCGGPMFDVGLMWLPEARLIARGTHAVILSNKQARFFGALWDARHRAAGVTRGAILNALYFDDPTGGEHSESLINTMASHLRTKLKPFGLQITASPGGAAPLYRLVGR